MKRYRVSSNIHLCLCFLFALGSFGLRPTAQAQTDQAGNQTVYTDTLQGGWVDYSWATTHLDSTGTVHGGGASISVDAGSYQALYLHRSAAFDTGSYGNLTFWIHGGPQGGQRLRVQALLVGKKQARYDLPPLLPGVWQKFSIALSLLGVDGKPDMDGFWIQNTSDKQLPTFYVDDIALTPAQTVNVTVNAGQVVRDMDNRFSGINLTADDTNLNQLPAASGQLTTEQLLGADGLDNRTLRIPGGSDSDRYHWETATLVDRLTGQREKTGVSIAQFAKIAENTHAQVVLTVNYGSGTPNEAAALIAYVNGHTDDGTPLGSDENGRDWGKVSDWAQLRAAAPLPGNDPRNVLRSSHPQPFGIKLIEIGNECWGKTWECDLHGTPYSKLPGDAWKPWTYADYAGRFMKQMRAIDPTLKIGVVATYDDQYDGWNHLVFSALKGLGAYPDFVVQHWYPQDPRKASDAGLFAANAQWPANASNLQAQISAYLQPPGSVEMLVTEINSVYSDPGKQSVSLTNALFLADSIGHALQTAYNGLLVWDLRDYQNTEGNANFGPPDNDDALDGWRTVSVKGTSKYFGDYGILHTDEAGSNTFYPTYYVLKMLKHFARSGDAIVAAACDDPRLSAYAALRADGSLSLMLVNTDKSADIVSNIALKGFQPQATAVTYTYGYFQDRTEDPGSSFYGVFPAGIAQSTFPGAATGFAYRLAPYSVTVLSLAPAAALSSVSLNPATVSGGASSTGTVLLTGAAPAGGAAVTLASSSAAAATPGAVLVPAGATSATFSVGSSLALAATSATITAMMGGVTKAAALSITPTPGTQFAAGLNFFSVPFDYSGVPLDRLFGYSGVTLAAWSPQASQYALTPAQPADQIRLGRGYWARFPRSLALTSLGAAADISQDFAIPLAAGWNSIGDPFFVPVPLGSLTFAAGGTSLPFGQASVQGGMIAASVFGYDANLNGGVGGYFPVAPGDSLQPGRGYWIAAFQSVTLKVPHP